MGEFSWAPEVSFRLQHDLLWQGSDTVSPGLVGIRKGLSKPWHILAGFLYQTLIHWVWVNYNELTTSSLEIMVSKGNHPQMALFQVCELL